MDTKILTQLEETFSEEIALVEQDLGSFEEMVIKQMLKNVSSDKNLPE